MPLFPEPTIDAIRKESRLRPEQADAVFSSNDLMSDIRSRVPAQMARVETEVLNMANGVKFPFEEEWMTPRHPDIDVEEENPRLQLQLTRCVILLALVALYQISGQLNKAYPDRAEIFKAEYVELMATIRMRFEFLTGKQSDGDSFGPPSPPPSQNHRACFVL